MMAITLRAPVAMLLASIILTFTSPAGGQPTVTSDALDLQEFGPEIASEAAAPVQPQPTPELRRGMVHDTTTPQQQRERRYFERIIARIEPSLEGQPDRLGIYTHFFLREFVNDRRLFPVQLDATLADDGQTVRVTGYVAYAETRRAYLRFLQYLGFEQVDDAITMLPDTAVLGEELFGLLSVPHSFTLDAQGEKMTESLLGDPLWLLTTGANDDYLVLSVEGYVGHVGREKVHRMDAAAFRAHMDGPLATIGRDVSLDDGRLIPAGARLRSLGVANDGRALVEWPGSGPVAVAADAVTVRSNSTPASVINALETAQSFLGTPYVWGGNTTKGVDCSGLVQSSFKAQGINFPRDADQQAYLGSLVATRWFRDNLRPGDTLYFLGERNGRITHTAIYVGDGMYIEATGPKVKFTSFDPNHEAYDAQRDAGFCFAKRLLE